MPDPDAQRLADQRVADLVRDAEKRGAAAERVDGRLGWLESHASEVNGQLVRVANAQDTMSNQLHAIAETLKVDEEVRTALLKASETSGERKLGRWQMRALLLGIVVGLITAVLYIVQLAQGLGHA